MKRFLSTLCAVCLITALCIPSVFATNHQLIGFYFTNTTHTHYSTYEAKSDNESNWYLSLDESSSSLETESTLSSNNIFGFKMHRRTNDVVDVYHTLDHFVTSKRYSYKAPVKKNDEMRLAGKKDDSSTSNYDLRILGRFAP